MQVPARILMTMIKPIRTEHGSNARDCRAPGDVRSDYVRAAKRHIFFVLEQQASLLQNADSLQYMGFQIEFGAGVGVATDKVESDVVKDQDQNAGKTFRIWVYCVRHRVGSMLWHIEGPGLLALLASDGRADVERCIDRYASIVSVRIF